MAVVSPKGTRGAAAHWWRILSGAISVGLVVVALVWVFGRHAQDLSLLRAPIDFRFVALALVVHACALLVAAYAWHRMTIVAGGERNLGRNVHVYVTTAFARRLPGSLWGPGLRMYWYKRLGTDWRGIAIASVAEAWAATVAGGLIALLGALLVIGPAADSRLWLALVAVLVGLIVLSTRPGRSWIRQRFGRFFLPQSFVSSSNGLTRELALWVGLEGLIWLLGGLELAAIVRALNAYSWGELPVVIACWAAAGALGSLITFVPGGFGLVELSLTGLLQFKFPLSVALAAAIGMRLVTTVGEAIWMLGGAAVLVGFSTVARRSRLRQLGDSTTMGDAEPGATKILGDVNATSRPDTVL